jgi:assimilatory nitrate reductase catalytic subunit
VLNTGRVRDQWHTMTRTGRVPRLLAHQGEPFLTMHPADAVRCGVADGELARIESRHGAAMLPVQLSAEQRPGEVFAPMHWTDRFASLGPVGRVVGAACDPISGQPELKITTVAVAPVAALWWGLLLRRSAGPMPERLYWSRVPLANGDVFALAGATELPREEDRDAWAARLLASPAGCERVVYADPGTRTFRWASFVGGRLDGCLFLAANRAALPSRETLAGLLDKELGGTARTGLLSGAPADPASSRGAGPTVCACFAVGQHTLHDAIAGGLTSLAAIGATLGAGTNCGSCIPELNALLREARAASD